MQSMQGIAERKLDAMIWQVWNLPAAKLAGTFRSNLEDAYLIVRHHRSHGVDRCALRVHGEQVDEPTNIRVGGNACNTSYGKGAI